MDKKEFYEAPLWGLRELRLERTVLGASDGEPNGFSEDDGTVTDDSDSWGNGN